MLDRPQPDTLRSRAVLPRPKPARNCDRRAVVRPAPAMIGKRCICLMTHTECDCVGQSSAATACFTTVTGGRHRCLNVVIALVACAQARVTVAPQGCPCLASRLSFQGHGHQVMHALGKGIQQACGVAQQLQAPQHLNADTSHSHGASA